MKLLRIEVWTWESEAAAQPRSRYTHRLSGSAVASHARNRTSPSRCRTSPFLRFTATLSCVIAVMAGHLFTPGTAEADEKQTGELLTTFVNEFVSIEPGSSKFPATFKMGDDSGHSSERPQHPVEMAKPFAMAKYEVPQNLYEAVMGSNPSRWNGPRNSVELMSWDDANEFCRKVTQQLRAQKRIGEHEVIRLPTEAEWEYCCRAGTITRYSFGDLAQQKNEVAPKASLLGEYGWHTGNAAGNDPPVGVLKPNPWGLYDMHGYLWEFTADAWSTDYSVAPVDGSAVAVSDETKSIVIRGGSWKDGFEKLTSTSRRRLARTDKDDAIGFRCVKSE